RRMAGDSARQADRAARYTRDPPGTMSSADAVHVAGLADGRGNHRVTARHRSCRSGALRLLDLSRRHDERLRLRPPAGRYAMSAEGNLPPARPRSRGGAAIAALIAVFVAALVAFAAGWFLGARRTVLTVPSPARDAVAYVFE